MLFPLSNKLLRRWTAEYDEWLVIFKVRGERIRREVSMAMEYEFWLEAHPDEQMNFQYLSLTSVNLCSGF